MRTMSGLVAACLTLLLSTASSARANPITNGDFSAGNTGFMSQYGFSPIDVIAQGVYTVDDNPFHVHLGGASFGDHTTGTGLMLIANGATTPGKIVWQQTVNVDTFTDFVFSGWAASWGNHQVGDFLDPAPAVLQFFVNGRHVGSNSMLPAQNGLWTEFSVSWNSGANSVVVLSLIDQQVASFGNDFAVDDLSLAAVPAVPEPSILASMGLGLLMLLLARRTWQR